MQPSDVDAALPVPSRQDAQQAAGDSHAKEDHTELAGLFPTCIVVKPQLIKLPGISSSLSLLSQSIPLD